MALTMKSMIAAALLVGMAMAAAGQADALKTRQAAMKAIGGAMGTMAKMAKGETPFDAAAAKTAVETIQAKAKGFDELFPAGSDKGETEAKATIWSDPAGFKAALLKLQTAADAQVAAPPASLDAVKATLGSLGGACKNCHDTYREKKS